MSHRHSNLSYNTIPQATLPPEPSPVAAPARSLLSALIPSKSIVPAAISIPSLPMGELFGGVSNTVRGLVLNDNWWVVLLIIFLFFPKISGKMFGGLFKE